MDTNFQMLRALNKWYNPEAEGFVSEKEKKLITEALCLAEMDVLALRNLRDFTVMFFSKTKEINANDKMSAILYLIDTEIFNRGGEV